VKDVESFNFVTGEKQETAKNPGLTYRDEPGSLICFLDLERF
jgi:hypothetical protein